MDHDDDNPLWVPPFCMKRGGAQAVNPTTQAVANRPQGVAGERWVYDLALVADLRDAGVACLPPRVSEMHKEVVRGKFVLQASRPPLLHAHSTHTRKIISTARVPKPAAYIGMVVPDVSARTVHSLPPLNTLRVFIASASARQTCRHPLFALCDQGVHHMAWGDSHMTGGD